MVERTDRELTIQGVEQIDEDLRAVPSYRMHLLHWDVLEDLRRVIFEWKAYKLKEIDEAKKAKEEKKNVKVSKV